MRERSGVICMSEEYKRCPDCDEDLPVEQFGKNRSTPSGLTAYCKEHQNERAYAWRKANPEKAKETKARADRKSNYGLSHDEYESLVESQDGRCGVCLDSLEDRKVHVDHDHETGKVRGVLHGTCNTMLGHAKDEPAILRLGAAYLEKVRA